MISDSPIYSAPHDLLLAANGVYKGSDGTRVRSGGISIAIIGERLIVGDDDTFAIHDLLWGNLRGR